MVVKSECVCVYSVYSGQSGSVSSRAALNQHFVLVQIHQQFVGKLNQLLLPQ